MKNKSIKLIQLVLLAVLAFSLYKIFDYYQKSQAYGAQTKDFQVKKEALVKDMDKKPQEGTIKTAKEKEEEAALALVKDLHQAYPQVLGRLLIKNTSIDFPFVQGKDNDYYLDHTYKNDAHPDMYPLYWTTQ